MKFDTMPATYNMHIETAKGVEQHGFHLGTILYTAEQFVFEQLRKPGVRSVALYLGPKCKANLHAIYDWRDLPGADAE